MDDKEILFKSRMKEMGEVAVRQLLNNPAYNDPNKKRWITDCIQEFDDERLRRDDATKDREMSLAREANMLARSANLEAWSANRIARRANIIAIGALIIATIAGIAAIMPFLQKVH